MKPLTLDQIKARDLRRVAVHESAHKAVARHFGIEGSVTIFANPDGDGIEEVYYLGRFQMFWPKPRDPNVATLIALAGVVAEHLDEDIDDDCGGWELSEEMSATDLDGAGAFTWPQVEQCVELVRSLWPQIEAEVAIAIEEALT